MKHGNGVVIVGEEVLRACGVTETDLDSLLVNNAPYNDEDALARHKARLVEISHRLFDAVPLLRLVEGEARITVQITALEVMRPMSSAQVIIPVAGTPRNAWLLAAARLMGEMHNVRVWTSDAVPNDGAFFLVDAEDPMTRLARVGAGLRIRSADVEYRGPRAVNNPMLQWEFTETQMLIDPSYLTLLGAEDETK